MWVKSMHGKEGKSVLTMATMLVNATTGGTCKPLIAKVLLLFISGPTVFFDQFYDQIFLEYGTVLPL